MHSASSEFAAFIRAAGFEIVDVRGYDGIKGVKDELGFVRSLLAHPRYGAAVRRFLGSSRFIERTFGHMMLFVCRKPQHVAPAPVPEQPVPLRVEVPLTPGMHLGVFLTRGMSLAAWDEVGMLEREMALYRRLASRGVKVTLMSYGGPAELAYASRFPGIGVCANTGGLTPAQYERSVEQVHERALSTVDVFRSNQTNGADVALRVARHFGRPMVARCGYLWSAFAGRECGNSSPEAAHARAIEEAVFTDADRIVVTTPAMAADVAGRLPQVAEKLMVTPNYVDTDLFAPAEGGEKNVGSPVHRPIDRPEEPPVAAGCGACAPDPCRDHRSGTAGRCIACASRLRERQGGLARPRTLGATARVHAPQQGLRAAIAVRRASESTA